MNGRKIFSAKGARCESLGHRPRSESITNFLSAEGAKCSLQPN